MLQEITDWGFRDLLQRRAARPAKAAPTRPYDALPGCMCDVVVEPLRAYSFAIDLPRRTIVFRAEIDRELTEDEADELYLLGTYVCSDNLLWVRQNDNTWIDENFGIVPPGQPIDPLPSGIGYLRPGERPPEAYTGLLPTAKSEERRAPYQPPSGET